MTMTCYQNIPQKEQVPTTGSQLQDITQYYGKKAIVTGGSRGIGSKVVEQLIDQNCQVTVLVRNSKGHCEDRSRWGLEPYELDLTNIQKIKKFKEWYTIHNGRPDFIFLVAGCMDTRGTSYGINNVIACNYLGHYQLIKMFLPELQNQGNLSKVVVVTCSPEGMQNVRVSQPTLDIPDTQITCNLRFLSKLYLLLLVYHLQQQGYFNVRFVAVNPGVVHSIPNSKDDNIRDEAADYILQKASQVGLDGPSSWFKNKMEAEDANHYQIESQRFIDKLLKTYNYNFIQGLINVTEEKLQQIEKSEKIDS